MHCLRLSRLMDNPPPPLGPITGHKAKDTAANLFLPNNRSGKTFLFLVHMLFFFKWQGSSICFHECSQRWEVLLDISHTNISFPGHGHQHHLMGYFRLVSKHCLHLSELQYFVHGNLKPQHKNDFFLEERPTFLTWDSGQMIHHEIFFAFSVRKISLSGEMNSKKRSVLKQTLHYPSLLVFIKFPTALARTFFRTHLALSRWQPEGHWMWQRHFTS